MTRRVAWAPGRVNLIGDHTDYTGGLAMPMAVDLGTTVSGETGGDRIILSSAERPEVADLPLYVPDPSDVDPPWARYVAGVVRELHPPEGFIGTITSTVPLGSGLSSSAALELAVALALGFDGSGRELAALCQRAEQLASGVPCGIMDQLTSALGVAGHALLIDFTTLDIDPVPIPPQAEIIVVHSGQERELASSSYAERRSACERAANDIGPLREATVDDVASLDDPVIRRRATHVVAENQRVRDFARAFRAGNLHEAGRLMLESHASLRDLFEVSTPQLDELVEALVAVPGIYGARLTGAGFGGCVVALGDERAPSALTVTANDPDDDSVVVPGLGRRRGWRVRAAAGARIVS